MHKTRFYMFKPFLIYFLNAQIIESTPSKQISMKAQVYVEELVCPTSQLY